MNPEANTQPGRPDAASTAARVTPLRTLLATAIVFGAAFALIGLAFTAFAVFSPAHKLESTSHLWGNFLMAGYLMVVGSVFSTVAFTLAVACCAHWRRLSPARAAMRSAFFGAVAFFISIAGLQYQVLSIVPILKSVPLLGVWLPIFLPGALVGALAVVARSLASRPARKAAA